MITHSLQHWRTTVAGFMAAGAISLLNLPTLDQLTWQQIGTRFIIACAVAALGAASADAKQNPGIVTEAPKDPPK